MGNLLRLRLVAVLLLASVLSATTTAQAAPSVEVETGNAFSRPQAGEVVAYKVAIDVVPAQGQSRVDLYLTYRPQEPDAVGWNTSVTLTRVGSGTSTAIGTLAGLDAPLVHRDLFEGRYELRLSVQTADVVADLPAFLEVAVSRPGEGQPVVGGVHRYDFLLQPPPDDDGDGLSNAREAALGTDPKKWDTDDDTLSDCQEVKHTVDVECRNFHFTALDGGYGTSPLKLDSDGDGMRDDVEVRFGTNPANADTDGDGLNDCQEVRHTKASECGKIASTLEDGGYKTDPWIVDEDEDGLLEGDEVAAGSDPLNEDTDGDGLLDGEEVHGTRNGAYGNASTDPTKKDTDGDLVSDFDEITKYGTDPNNKDTDGDGLDDNDESAGPNSPLKADSDDDGVNDFDERRVHKTDPVDPDTDGDGLNDGDEINVWKTQVLHPDSDGDGLSDGDEVHVYGTNPLYHDSDDDGLHDGREVDEYGTDPASADTDHDGLTDPAEIEHWNTDPTNPDSDADLLGDGNETVLGTDPSDPDSDDDGWLDGKEVLYGGDPLDKFVTPSDVDGDMLADQEDPDADGDGRDDDEGMQAANQRLTGQLRPRTALHLRDADAEGRLRVAFDVEPADDADGVRLWRQDGEAWVLVDEGEDAEDAEARDGARYRITGYRDIGAKRVGGGNASEVPGFEALEPWELFVTSARVTSDSVVLRADAARDFTLRVVHDGRSTDHSFHVDERSQTTVAISSLLEGVEGGYRVQWVDGGETFDLQSGRLAEPANLLPWFIGGGVGLLLVSGAIAALVLMRRNKK